MCAYTGLPAGAAIEATDSDTPGQQLQHRYKNLQPKLSTFQGHSGTSFQGRRCKRHGSLTSPQGGRKLQIGEVVKAVIVRVS